MHTLETIVGTRVVAPPPALDAAAWPPGTTVLQFAPDEAFVFGADSVPIVDEHAIVAPESGFVGRWLDAGELDHVAGHIDWPLPDAGARPVLTQGLVAGVPAKLYLTGSTGQRAALLLTNAPYADELSERLR